MLWLGLLILTTKLNIYKSFHSYLSIDFSSTPMLYALEEVPIKEGKVIIIELFHPSVILFHLTIG